MEQEVGKVSHYYDKLGVAILDLSAPLSVGDTVKFKKGEQEFKQKVDSIQVEHQAVQTAKPGDQVGIKVDQKVKDGVEVYKVS